jgi:transcriptional regulator with XRE-family HTH domain
MMAGKPKPMSQIKQLLQLHQQGKSKKEIARILGISRNTVKSYLRKTEESRLHAKELLKLEDPLLEGKFHPGNPSYKEDRYKHFKANVDYFLKELRRTGVTKQLLWEEYKAWTNYIIQNWMRTRNTIEFLGLWEQLKNPHFKGLEFDASRTMFILKKRRDLKSKQ